MQSISLDSKSLLLGYILAKETWLER